MGDQVDERLPEAGVGLAAAPDECVESLLELSAQCLEVHRLEPGQDLRREVGEGDGVLEPLHHLVADGMQS